MDKKLNLNLPINSVSFGQVSVSILYELWKRKIDFDLLPINQNIELGAFSYEKDFMDFLKQKSDLGKFFSSWDRNNPTLKFWHINGSHDSIGRDQVLLTFHETSELTDIEVNILRNQKAVIVSSKYTKEVFEKYGLDNVVYVPVGFDDVHFKRTNKKYLGEDIISFGLRGKLEKRKAHKNIIQAWIKKYGKNNKYRLNCSIVNPFLMKDIEPKNYVSYTKKYLEREFGQEIPYNVNFLPIAPTNLIYNDYLNACDIDLTGMSYCEGFNLPLFQSLCLGKQAVVFNDHVHKDYCNSKNSFLVQPNGEKQDAHDGFFFQKGSPFNQGKWNCWDEDEFIAQCEAAEKVAKKINTEGEKLKKQFSYEKCVDGILNVIL